MNTSETCDSLNNNVSDKDEDISSNGQDTVYGGIKKGGSLKYVISTAYLVGFTLVAIYAVSRGTPAKLVHPYNSKGELCGHQNQTGKPNLIYFDVTKCTGLVASQEGCAKPQVCVAECPNTYWTSSQGKPTGLDQFCDNLLDGNTADISSLVEDRLCPAYLLPSRPVLGRCVPLVVLGHQEKVGKTAAKMKAMNTDDGKVLNVDSLMKGIDYVMDTIDSRSQTEKLVALIFVYWCILLVSYLVAIVFSITWTALIKITGNTAFWICQALSLAVLLACMVFSFMMYRHMMIGRQDGIPTNGLSSYWFNKISWLAYGVILILTNLSIFIFDMLYFQSIKISIKHIFEVSKAISDTKMIFLPIIKSLLHVLIISCSLVVSVCLATIGSQEFRVVESCSSETCFNNDTEKMFSLHDICDPTAFGDCTGCPRAHCVYHQYVPDSLASCLHAFNLAGMVWLLFLVQSWQDLKMTESGLSFTLVGLLGRIKKTFMDRCRKSSWKSFQSFQICHTNVWEDSFWWERCTNLFRITDRKIVMRRVAKMIIISTTLSITGTVALIVIGLFAFFTEVNISSDFHLNYHVGPIFILIFGTYLITSTFLDIYKLEEVIHFHDHKSIKLNDCDIQHIDSVEEEKIQQRIGKS